MSFDLRNTGLHDLVQADARIERIAGGLTFTEGPVWRGDALLFSDIPNSRIARWRRLAEKPELTTAGCICWPKTSRCRTASLSPPTSRCSTSTIRPTSTSAPST